MIALTLLTRTAAQSPVRDLMSVNESSRLGCLKNGLPGDVRGGFQCDRLRSRCFVLAWFVLSWPWLSGAVTIPYDAKALFQAELQFLANAIHPGQSPFWSPNVFGGIPQIADPQSLIFSPLVLLALLAPHPSFHALDVAVLVLLALAGIAVLMYLPRPRLASGGRDRGGARFRVRRLGGVAHPAHRADRELRVLRRHALAAGARARSRLGALRRLPPASRPR